MFDKIYRIHPSIGFARLGNADALDHFVGPTIPESNAADKNYSKQFPDTYKKDGKIRPQAALFTIWEYKEKNGKPIREITLDERDVESIGWKVNLANKKAAFYKFAAYYGRTEPNDQGFRNKGKPDEWTMLPGPRTISGKNIGNKDDFRFKKGTSGDPTKEQWLKDQKPDHQYLGELFTDDKGRLKVIGGKGIGAAVNKKFKLKETFNNAGWYDDVSDGTVEVSITFKRGKVVNAIPAWVIVAPPDYAPEIKQIVTLYDYLSLGATIIPGLLKSPMLELYPHLKDIADEFKANGVFELTTYKPHFHDDIYPILLKAFNSKFVHAETYKAHGLVDVYNLISSLNNNDPSLKSMRQILFKKLREPYSQGELAEVKKAVKKKKFSFKSVNVLMPLLFGDTFGEEPSPYLTLTHVQYQVMKRWADGDFIVSSGPTKVDNPMALDIASLENAVGGAFYPGTDIGWSIASAKIFSEPFRIDHTADDQYQAKEITGKIAPGYFTRQLAVPWHADFMSCAKDSVTFYGFWPSQRPDDVLVGGSMKPWYRNDKGKFPGSWDLMVAKWYELGFVTKNPDKTSNDYYIETERGSIK